MTGHDTDHDDVLKELDAALQVEPSRAFAEGVRARVHRSRTSTTRLWWGLAAAASLGLATMSLWRPAVQTPVQVASTPAPASVVSKAAPAPEPVVVVEQPTPPIRHQAVTVVRVAANTTSEPRLEVITNQPGVLRELWADVRGRTLVMVEAAPVIDGLSPKPIEVTPVEVKPIVVNEIGKEPMPAGASPIIRRANATKETR